MQVNNVNSNNTAFGARFRVKPQYIDYVMEAIDRKCGINSLKRIYKALESGETGIGSDEVVFIEPILKRGKKEIPAECGFIKTKIGEWTYSNDVVPTYSFWSLPHFFEKIQRLSKEKFYYPMKNDCNRISEFVEQFNLMCERALDGKTKDIRGAQTERDGVLDGIFTILSGRRK